MSAAKPWEGFITDVVPPLSAEQMRRFAGRRILITGAGGFIGSALAKLLATVPGARLVLLDSAEYGLYRLEQDLRRIDGTSPAIFLLGSVCNAHLLEDLCRTYAPEIVFHAAALKHVPLTETNALAAAETNILGTELVVQTAARHGVERLILLSTDKAVAPVSVMGATKRLAEQITLTAGRGTSPATAFTIVRLCNVLGSTGSVAPLFAGQIAAGGPVTVTHPEVSRYFLSPQDAVRSLLHAATRDGEDRLLVPRVEAPRRITQLAEYLISHMQHDDSVMIVYTGLRAADKMHEVFTSARESIQPTQRGNALLAVRSPVMEDPGALLRRVRQAVGEWRVDLLMPALEEVLSESPGEVAPGPRQPVTS